MKRTLIACVAIAFGASMAPAASPEVDKAIKTIQAVASDPAKMKLFCTLDGAIETADGQTDATKADPAVEKQIEDLLAQLGPEFEAAWDVGDELDEKSPDGVEFAAALEALAAKCQ
jgi:hypothetical protein